MLNVRDEPLRKRAYGRVRIQNDLELQYTEPEYHPYMKLLHRLAIRGSVHRGYCYCSLDFQSGLAAGLHQSCVCYLWPMSHLKMWSTPSAHPIDSPGRPNCCPSD